MGEKKGLKGPSEWLSEDNGVNRLDLKLENIIENIVEVFNRCGKGDRNRPCHTKFMIKNKCRS